MTRSGRLRLAGRALGIVLLILSMGWVVARIVATWQEVVVWAPTARTWIVVAALSLVTGCGLLLTIGVWLSALSSVGALGERSDAPGLKRHGRAESPAGFGRRLAAIHALAQIGKYLPGNVVHLAGRHVATSSLLGGANGRVAAAALVESAQLATAAVATAVLAALLGAEVAPPSALAGLALPEATPMVFGAMALGTAIVIALLVRAVRTRASLDVAAAFRGCGWGVTFFVLQGVVLGAVTWLVAGRFTSAAFVAAPVAWLLGYVVPGAPAGLGVREAVLIALLAGAVTEPYAILSALIFRLVAVIGDLVFFGIAVAGSGGTARARGLLTRG